MRVMVTVDVRDVHSVMSALEAGGVAVDRSVPAVPLPGGEAVIICDVPEGRQDWVRQCPGVVGVFSDPDIESTDEGNHICCGGCTHEEDEDD